MFRITKGEDGSRVVISLDGELRGESVEAVESLCGQELLAGKVVNLILRDLTMIDRGGCALLKRLLCCGVHLQASGIYDSYLVQALLGTTGSGETAEK